ncbi:MAG: tyrosine-type recombinase/integrase [Ignavibacteriales bacterium]|nr:tyrosine-type recombinase/integrase [Ignavibacteriales bacterium]
MEEILKNISADDLEKLKLLISIMPGQEPKEVVTLRVFKDEYSTLIKNSRSKAYYNSVNIALNHLIDFFGIQHSIKAIQLKDIEDFLTHLQQKVKKGHVVYYRNLKAAFNKAKDWGYIKENCFTKVKLPKRQKMAPIFINSDQLSVIRDQIKSEKVKDFVMIAFYTGMRLDEIVNLRWKNVDLNGRIITVGDEEFTTKGRTQRFIPMSEEALKIIENLDTSTRLSAGLRIRQRNGGQVQNEKQKKIISIKSRNATHNFVFCKENGKMFTGNYFSRRFKDACKSAGMDNGIHFHSLRHSFASNLAQKGVSLYTIKELLGHSSISTTEIYSHLNMDCLREAVKKLDTGDKILDTEEKQKNELKIFRINSGENK